MAERPPGAPAASVAPRCSGSERRPDCQLASGSSYRGITLCWGATRPATTVPGLRLSDLANALSLDCSLREQVVTGSGIGIKTCVRIRSQNPAPSPVLDDYCGVGLCADEPDLPCTLTTLQRSTGRPPTEKFVTLPTRISGHLIEGVW